MSSSYVDRSVFADQVENTWSNILTLNTTHLLRKASWEASLSLEANNNFKSYTVEQNEILVIIHEPTSTFFLTYKAFFE